MLLLTYIRTALTSAVHLYIYISALRAFDPTLFGVITSSVELESLTKPERINTNKGKRRPKNTDRKRARYLNTLEGHQGSGSHYPKCPYSGTVCQFRIKINDICIQTRMLNLGSEDILLSMNEVPVLNAKERSTYYALKCIVRRRFRDHIFKFHPDMELPSMFAQDTPRCNELFVSLEDESVGNKVTTDVFSQYNKKKPYKTEVNGAMRVLSSIVSNYSCADASTDVVEVMKSIILECIRCRNDMHDMSRIEYEVMLFLCLEAMHAVKAYDSQDVDYSAHINSVAQTLTAPLKGHSVSTESLNPVYVHSDLTVYEQVEVIMDYFKTLLGIEGVIDPVFDEVSYANYERNYDMLSNEFNILLLKSEGRVTDKKKITNIDMMLYPRELLKNARDVIIALHEHRKLYHSFINIDHVNMKIDEKYGIFNAKLIYTEVKNNDGLKKQKKKPTDSSDGGESRSGKCSSLISFISFCIPHC